MIQPIYKYALLAAGMAMLASCGESKDDGPKENVDPNSVAITLTTEVFTQANVTTEHKDGDAITVFTKQYNSPEAVDLVAPAKGVMQGANWTMTPEIRLSKGQVGFIYIVSPYDASYTTPKAIPVDLSKQVDLLYSGASVPVSYNSNKAKVTLKHALTLASFNIASDGYTGAGKLTGITVGGTRVYSAGTLDASTGKVTGTDRNTVNASFNANISAEGFKENLPGMWMIPFSTQNASEADATTITFTIDGRSYALELPGADLNTGLQTIYHLVLSNHGLQFIPTRTQQVSLNQNSDSFEKLEGHGIISVTVEGSQWLQPLFSGSEVYGTLVWGNDMATYNGTSTIKFADAGQHNVVIETWGSTGFEIPTLEGVSEISFVDYE